MASTAHQSELPAEGRTPKSAGAEAPSPPVLDKAAVSAHDLAIPADAEPSLLVQALLCCVSILEGADTQLLGASMRALQEDIGLHLTDLAYMTVSQAVCTNIAAPLWGILADRGVMRRRTILVVGAMGQGLVTILLAFVTDLIPMILLRALNGILLAALRPISNGIIADMTGEQKRGKIFGRVQSALLFGMFITTMSVVPMAGEIVLGFHGWRVAFVLVGLISVVVSALVLVFMVEPPHTQPEGMESNACRAVIHEFRSLARFFTIPTFCVMIMQGVFGTIPWSVFGNMTLFFQLSGIDDMHVAILSGVGPITGAVGNIVGGVVSDLLAWRFLLHGRPLSAQITVACGLPLIYMIFQGIPPGHGSFGTYLALNIAFGILGSWAQSGTNYPILSHIVPADARSRVMAWESALENSLANAIGPTVVGLLAEDVFGYKFGSQSADGGPDLASADALGKAMAAVICIPWVICFFAYTLLHWSYPRDVRLLEERAAREAELTAEAKARAADEALGEAAA